MPNGRTTIRQLWRHLNARDFEKAGGLLHPEVDWACILEGGRLHGPESVLAYWRRMMDYVRPESAIVTFAERPDGRIAVRMRHALRRPEGGLWTEEDVIQVFGFQDGLIVRMDEE
jgi:limonene-1,2-epoxide hydrolase